MLLAVPAQDLRTAAIALNPQVKAGTPVIACAKGIERSTRSFMTDIVAGDHSRRGAGDPVGPELRDGCRARLADRRSAPAVPAVAGDRHRSFLCARPTTFRPYHTTDVRGVEIGGAAKNVLAIAAGMVEGRGLGDSAKAALVARGFAELRRFAAAHGAKPETLMGLSGLGDLMLSTSSSKSRNFAFGLALGRGEPPAIATHGKLAEGFFTAGVVSAMARAAGIAMPVCEAVAAILDAKLSIDTAIDALMNRPVRAEE